MTVSVNIAIAYINTLNHAKHVRTAETQGRFVFTVCCLSFSGYVTTFFQEDIELMHELLNKPVRAIQKGGIHPTADQVGKLKT